MFPTLWFIAMYILILCLLTVLAIQYIDQSFPKNSSGHPCLSDKSLAAYDIFMYKNRQNLYIKDMEYEYKLWRQDVYLEGRTNCSQ